MCATKTVDVEATVAQTNLLWESGAGVVRIAVDNLNEVAALAKVRDCTTANLSVDLQENYRLALKVAPLVDKIRYNPGHLYHFEPERAWQDKVRMIADTAGENDCAIRIGVNCGSVDPAKLEKYVPADSITPMLESALEHSEFLDSLGFTHFCVSLKDSHPAKVVEANRRFARERPDVPLHLGVTEAGMPPEGIVKTQVAFEQLISQGIGDTIRVSLTVPNNRKHEEIAAGRKILDDIEASRFLGQDSLSTGGLNIISCPSCSRVENASFVELAEKVRKMTEYAANQPFTIAVMGCRVNGPGETDDADLGLWCGANRVNLKRGGQSLGKYTYDEILHRLRKELDSMIASGNRG